MGFELEKVLPDGLNVNKSFLVTVEEVSEVSPSFLDAGGLRLDWDTVSPGIDMPNIRLISSF